MLTESMGILRRLNLLHLPRFLLTLILLPDLKGFRVSISPFNSSRKVRTEYLDPLLLLHFYLPQLICKHLLNERKGLMFQEHYHIDFRLPLKSLHTHSQRPNNLQRSLNEQYPLLTTNQCLTSSILNIQLFRQI